MTELYSETFDEQVRSLRAQITDRDARIEELERAAEEARQRIEQQQRLLITLLDRNRAYSEPTPPALVALQVEETLRRELPQIQMPKAEAAAPAPPAFTATPTPSPVVEARSVTPPPVEIEEQSIPDVPAYSSEPEADDEDELILPPLVVKPVHRVNSDRASRAVAPSAFSGGQLNGDEVGDWLDEGVGGRIIPPDWSKAGPSRVQIGSFLIPSLASNVKVIAEAVVTASQAPPIPSQPTKPSLPAAPQSRRIERNKRTAEKSAGLSGAEADQPEPASALQEAPEQDAAGAEITARLDRDALAEGHAEIAAARSRRWGRKRAAG